MMEDRTRPFSGTVSLMASTCCRPTQVAEFGTPLNTVEADDGFS